MAPLLTSTTFKDDPIHQSFSNSSKKPITGGQHYPDTKARQGHCQEIKLQAKFSDDHRHKNPSQNTERPNAVAHSRVTHHNKMGSFLGLQGWFNKCRSTWDHEDWMKGKRLTGISIDKERGKQDKLNIFFYNETLNGLNIEGLNIVLYWCWESELRVFLWN